MLIVIFSVSLIYTILSPSMWMVYTRRGGCRQGVGRHGGFSCGAVLTGTSGVECLRVTPEDDRQPSGWGAVYRAQRGGGGREPLAREVLLGCGLGQPGDRERGCPGVAGDSSLQAWGLALLGPRLRGRYLIDAAHY